MAHTWDPERYLAFADERSRRSSTSWRVSGAAAPHRRRPRLRAGQPDGAAGRPVAGRGGAQAGLEPRDGRAGSRDRGGDLRGRRPPRLGAALDRPDHRSGRRAGSNATLPVGARPPRPAAAVGRRGRPGGWLGFQVPANFDGRPATPSARSLPPRSLPRHTEGVARAQQPRPGHLPRGARRARLPGRRAWDDVPPRLHRPRPGFTWVSAPAPARPCRRCPTTCAEFEAEFRERLAAAPSTRTASCCRSAGSSSSPGSVRRRELHRAARLPAGRGTTPAASGSRGSGWPGGEAPPSGAAVGPWFRAGPPRSTSVSMSPFAPARRRTRPRGRRRPRGHGGAAGSPWVSRWSGPSGTPSRMGALPHRRCPWQPRRAAGRDSLPDVWKRTRAAGVLVLRRARPDATSRWSAASGAFMCGTCLDYYAGVVAEVRRTGVERPPPWHDMSDADLLRNSADRRDRCTGGPVHDRVVGCCAPATSLGRDRPRAGVTRQAAWERFAG